MDSTAERSWVVTAVGVVSSPRREIVDDNWGATESTISLLAPFDASAAAGLNEFSHIEVIYLFDQVDPATLCTGSRHPRGNTAWPEVGIFAQRAKDRPNRIGLSVCELLAVDGTELLVRGLDAVDGTPVLDIKPYMEEFGPRSAVRQPTWAHQLMKSYF
jgi:tRNA (adenine37-N6)-methyltransferase